MNLIRFWIWVGFCLFVPLISWTAEKDDSESSNGTQRHDAHSSTYLGFGGAAFSNLNHSSIGFSFGTAHAWEVNQIQIKILGEGNFAGNGFFVNAGLGGNYFFTGNDFSPYVGADFGGGIAKMNAAGMMSGEVVGGFVLGLGGGIEVLRTASVHLDLGFRAVFLLNSNSVGIPESYTMRLGIYF